MQFTDSEISNTGFKVVGRVEKEEKPDNWGPAIEHAHGTAWYVAQMLLLEANGVNIDDERSSLSDKLAVLWEHAQEAVEARGCDLKDIDLLEGYKGEIPRGKGGNPSARFTMVGLCVTPRYREEFVAYLQENRIPGDLVLLAFPARRGVKDGKFNLKLAYDK